MNLAAQNAPSPRLLAGSIVVAVVLGLSRWGTNIGIAPLFICDALIALSVFHLVASRSLKGRPAVDRRYAGTATALFAVLFAYMLARIVLAVGQSEVLVWLRDAVPFLYAALAFVAAASIARSSETARANTFRLFRWALTIHVIWVAAVAFTGNLAGFNVLGPIGSAPAFEVRPDIDCALIGIAAALNLRQTILGRRRFWNIAGLVLGVVVVFTAMGTRAGQIGFIVALTLSYVLTFAASRRAKGRQLFMVTAVPILLAALIIVIPSTPAGERLIATVAPALSSGTEAQLGAQGTQRARELTWSQVIDWTNEEPARAIFGSGFGNDFLATSGTLAYLEGTTYSDVRSPHNWFVGIYARMGIVGTVLMALWMLQLAAIVWRNRERIGTDDLGAFSAVTVVAIMPVATLGVVLEAPFGAIPFFWAGGVIMSLRRGVRPDQPNANHTQTARPTSVNAKNKFNAKTPAARQDAAITARRSAGSARNFA